MGFGRKGVNRTEKVYKFKVSMTHEIYYAIEELQLSTLDDIWKQVKENIPDAKEKTFTATMCKLVSSGALDVTPKQYSLTPKGIKAFERRIAKA